MAFDGNGELIPPLTVGSLVPKKGGGRAGLGAPRGRMTLAQALEPDPMTDTAPTPGAGPAAPIQTVVPLGDLGLAPENLRFKEPADDGVPQLAETILAAGVVVPLIVRPGRKGEKPYMALDGRRRLFGLELLLEAGRIEPTIRSAATSSSPRPRRRPRSCCPTPSAAGPHRRRDRGHRQAAQGQDGHRRDRRRAGLRRAGDQAAGGALAGSTPRC